MSNNCHDGSISPLGSVDSSTSDFQFRASLDALLEFDNLDTGSNTDGSSTDPLMQVNNTLSNKRNEEAMNAFLQQQEQALSGEISKPTVGMGEASEFPTPQPTTEAPQQSPQPIAQSSQFPVPQPLVAQHQQLPQQVQSSMHPSMFAMSALPSVPYGSLTIQQQQQQQQQQHQQNSSQQMAMYFGQQQCNTMIAMSLQQMATSTHPPPAAAASNAPSMSLSMNHHASPAPPSCLSSSIRSENNKRVRYDTVSAISEDERVRHDRNSREKQRSKQITTQIEELRHLINSANVDHVEKAGKYSTLVTVGEYIKQLHGEAAELEAEHGRLVDTITLFDVPATTRKLGNTLPRNGGPSCEAS
jgi:hypothetical protein